MFDLAPVSLWLEDLSSLRCLLDEWRALGVTDIRAFLREDLDRLTACWNGVRVIKVNRRTLTLFEAESVPHLIGNLDRIFRDDFTDERFDQMAQFWDAEVQFTSRGANYTLSGRRLELQFDFNFLPGHENDWSRVLVAVEDLTERENARRLQERSESYARSLFEHSPISLWVEDFSAIKRSLDTVRASGVVDFPAFIEAYPDFVRQCLGEIRILDVNSHTLSLFKAPSKAALINQSDYIMGENTDLSFARQLNDLWDGRLFQNQEVTYRALDGTILHAQLQISVFPGYETDWSLVLVALTDMTSRKETEAHLAFLGNHDVVTALYNRSYYAAELDRLERQDLHPLSIAVADLNGLKRINDRLGHAAGDRLLKSMADILTSTVQKPNWAARIGGDEFAIVMPFADASTADLIIGRIIESVAVHAQLHHSTPLSMSIGVATRQKGEKLDIVFSRADAAMYASKKSFYARTTIDHPCMIEAA